MIGYVVFILAGFFSGGVMYSYWIPLKLKGIDIVCDSPDGNAGVWNVARFAGRPMAGLCLFCDIIKGFLPVFLAWHLVDPYQLLFVLVVIAPVIAHIISPFSRRLSGKGITTAFGVLFGLVGLPGSWAFLVLGAFYLFLLVGVKLEPHELLSICACGMFSVVMAVSVVWGVPFVIALSCIATSLVVIVRAIQTKPTIRPSTRWSKQAGMKDD